MVFLILRDNRMWFGLFPCNPTWVDFTRPVIPALEVNADLVCRLQVTEHSSAKPHLFSGHGGCGALAVENTKGNVVFIIE